jgi:hypothetical protein
MSFSAGAMQPNFHGRGHSPAKVPFPQDAFVTQIYDRLRRNKVPFTCRELTAWLKGEWPPQEDHAQALLQIVTTVKCFMQENIFALPRERIYLDVFCVQRRSGCSRYAVEQYFARYGARIMSHNLANGFDDAAASPLKLAA